MFLRDRDALKRIPTGSSIVRRTIIYVGPGFSPDNLQFHDNFA